jgi:hypothetical protein
LQIHTDGFGPDERYLVAAPVTHGTSTYPLQIFAQGGRHVLPGGNKPATPAAVFVTRANAVFMPEKIRAARAYFDPVPETTYGQTRRRRSSPCAGR